jgi:hypothetical protein
MSKKYAYKNKYRKFFRKMEDFRFYDSETWPLTL